MVDDKAQARFNNWLVEQVAASIVAATEGHGAVGWDESVRWARDMNDHPGFTFDGSHPQENWVTRMSDLHLSEADLDRAVAMAEGLRKLTPVITTNPHDHGFDFVVGTDVTGQVVGGVCWDASTLDGGLVMIVDGRECLADGVDGVVAALTRQGYDLTAESRADVAGLMPDGAAE